MGVSIDLKPGQHYPRQARLLDKRDFARVFEQAARAGSASFTLLCRENRCGEARLGLAISKRALRRATDRNRIKRLVRESFRLSRSRLGGRDFVVMVRRGFPGNRLRREQMTQLRAEIDALWARGCKRCAAADSITQVANGGAD